MHHGRFNFMRQARIWYSRDLEQEMLPGTFENEVVPSDEFYREILDHSGGSGSGEDALVFSSRIGFIYVALLPLLYDQR